jgi:hypothetical protein
LVMRRHTGASFVECDSLSNRITALIFIVDMAD